MVELRQRSDLVKGIGINPKAEGRGAITGVSGDGVWDYLSFELRSLEDAFNKHMHLTLSVDRQGVSALVIVPDKSNSITRRRMTELGVDGFQKLIGQIVNNMKQLLEEDAGAVPLFVGFTVAGHRGKQNHLLTQC